MCGTTQEGCMKDWLQIFAVVLAIGGYGLIIYAIRWEHMRRKRQVSEVIRAIKARGKKVIKLQ